MPEFSYQARDRLGASHTGTLEAADRASLTEMLRQRGWLVVKVRAVAGSSSATTTVSALSRLLPGSWMPPRPVEIEISLQQIATMLRSGLTLLSALDTVARQAPRPAVRRIWQQIALRIQEGISLSQAMSEHRCFDRLVIQLAGVGEQTGSLDAVLSRAADTLEARRQLRSSLITAMIYPAIVLVMAMGTAAFMVLSVIPKLERSLNNLGHDLPAMTQMLMDFSAWMRNYLPTLGAGLVLLVVGFVLLYLWPAGRLVVDRLALRLPVIGRLLRIAATAGFARTMGILIRSGITVLEALRTVEGLHRNRYLAYRVAVARQEVLEGGALAEPLSYPYAYMPMLASMVHVGESAGSLDDTLDEVSQFHERQLESAIKRFSAIVEPIIIIVVGSIVGFVYVSFFLAMFKFAGGAI